MSRSYKTLLVIAELLALPFPARAADLPIGDLPISVRLYGFLNAEIEWVRALGGATPYAPRRRVSDGNSRFGIFGAWNLTPQTAVQVQLEALLNNFEQGGVNDQGHFGTLASRNSFVGVSDKRLGMLLAGYYDNAYRSLVGTGGGFGGNLGLTGLGLDLWNNTSAAVSGGFANLFGRGEAGMRIGPVNDVSTNFYKVIVSYAAPTGTYVGLGYERSVYGFANFTQPGTGTVYSPIAYGTMSQGGAMASVAQAFEDLTLMGSFGKLGKLSDSIVGSGDDYQATQFSLGAKYAFGRPFMVYAYFTRVDNKPLQNINLGVPIYSNHLGTSEAFLAPGNNPMAGGIGLIARF